MRTRILPVTLAIVGLALAGAHAKADSIEAQIPFEFVIGDKVMPPAAYIIDVAGDTGPSVLTIRTKESGERVMFDTIQIAEKDAPDMLGLVFDTLGNKTYLTEVWGVVNTGREVKHMVDGKPLKRVTEASRKRIAATRIVDEKEKKSDK